MSFSFSRTFTNVLGKEKEILVLTILRLFVIYFQNGVSYTTIYHKVINPTRFFLIKVVLPILNISNISIEYIITMERFITPLL